MRATSLYEYLRISFVNCALFYYFHYFLPLHIFALHISCCPPRQRGSVMWVTSAAATQSTGSRREHINLNATTEEQCTQHTALPNRGSSCLPQNKNQTGRQIDVATVIAVCIYVCKYACVCVRSVISYSSAMLFSHFCVIFCQNFVKT